jgi:hypothetical protein
MTLPSSGPISFSQINVELGRAYNASYSLNENNIRKLASVGFTGVQTNTNTVIPFSSLKGHAWNVVTINSPVTNYTFSNPAPGKTYGVLVVTSTGVIGSTSADSAALVLQGITGDVCIVQNSGYIVGKGGNAGAGSSPAGGGANGQGGFPGGIAILLGGQGAFADIQNGGTIGGGGGGGGGGYGTQDTQNQNRVPMGGGGGGGGAGYLAGDLGAGGNRFGGAGGTGLPGTAGTLITGGRGGSGGYQFNAVGGTGGNLGQNGGQSGYGYGGGQAGYSVYGTKYLISSLGGTVLGLTNI